MKILNGRCLWINNKKMKQILIKIILYQKIVAKKVLSFLKILKSTRIILKKGILNIKAAMYQVRIKKTSKKIIYPVCEIKETVNMEICKESLKKKNKKEGMRT